MFVEVDVVSAFSSSTTGCETSRSEMERWKILHSVKDLGVGIANDIEWLVYKTIQFKLFAVINLNSKVNKPLRLSKDIKLLNRKKLTYMLIHTFVNFTIHILFLSI